MRNLFTFSAFVILATFTPLAHAVDVLVGSFEGTTLGNGWNDWNYGGPHEFSNSTTGATNGSMSIKVTPGTLGYAQSLTLKLQELPSPLREEAFDGFVNNTHLAFDVTWDASEWHYQGEGLEWGAVLAHLQRARRRLQSAVRHQSRRQWFHPTEY